MTEVLAKAGWIFVAVLMGVMLTWQSPVNAEAARRFGSPLLAGMMSIGLSFLLLSVFALFTLRGLPGREAVASMPWWAWLGGITGAFFIICAVYVVQHTGNFVLVASVIAGQMVGALAADKFGMWGLPQVEISAPKLAAVGLVLAGAMVFHLSE